MQKDDWEDDHAHNIVREENGKRVAGKNSSPN
jgi:hypothetical protein